MPKLSDKEKEDLALKLGIEANRIAGVRYLKMLKEASEGQQEASKEANQYANTPNHANEKVQDYR